MQLPKPNVPYRIKPSAASYRLIIALVFLIMFMLSGWVIALFVAGFFSGMAFVLKVWSLEFDIILVRRDKESD